jgi:hypothetical protein
MTIDVPDGVSDGAMICLLMQDWCNAPNFLIGLTLLFNKPGRTLTLLMYGAQ